MAGEDFIELKFRLADGTDIGPSKFSPITTVASLKEKIISQWPKGTENGPKMVNNVQLIHAGKILENNMTIAESRLPVVELPASVITMHVVLRPSLPDKKGGGSVTFGDGGKAPIVGKGTINFPDKLQSDSPKSMCSCSIL